MIEANLTTAHLNALIELDDKSPALPSEIAHCFTDMKNQEAVDLLEDLVGYGLATKEISGQYNVTDNGEKLACLY